MTDYREKIQTMLVKITNNEPVFEPIKKDEIGEIIRQVGVKDGLRTIFKSDTTIITESIEQELDAVKVVVPVDKPENFNGDSQFEEVTSVSDVPTVAPMWQKLQRMLRRQGKDIDETPTSMVRDVQHGNDHEKITVKLVKNKDKEDRKSVV